MQVKDGEKEPLLPSAEQGSAARPDPEQPGKNAGEVKQGTPKRPSWWSVVKSLISLRSNFSRFGRCVGKYPRSFLLLSMLLSLCSYGMRGLVLRDDVREGYTAYDARSRYEAQVSREFYGAIDDPMITSLLMLAKDGGTMHRKEYLDEANEIVQSVQNLTMKYGERRLIYREMCKPHCFGDEIFNAFKRGFDVGYGLTSTVGILTELVNLSYPLGKIMGIPAPFERCLYGVRLNPPKNLSENDSFFLGLFSFSKSNQSIETQITNMEHVTYHYNVNNKWDHYFSASIASRSLIILVSVEDRAVVIITWVGIGATLCPMLAITCTYGIVSMTGSRVNSLLFVMPFLIMGVGVDAAFLMLNTVLETVVRMHCNVVSNKIAAMLIFTALFVYWYFAITGPISSYVWLRDFIQQANNTKEVYPYDLQAACMARSHVTDWLEKI
ncbi:hypothetical protein TELCIR_03995 [Teladorsagia circumcincta]|uniref:SSD domain-containing protein n=1 Tax=Teladorsagia circumcincta TaxID=45464 RepID=A0A2G9UUS8_TELCI|nr:hypothetical protein TELCIR_03995 [Teladorsagia circumcincta]